jgi:two-component system, response regulator
MSQQQKVILLVEDNDDDIELTTMAFARAKILNPVVIARDGVLALDYLFGTGEHVGRDIADHPVVVLLDLKLPRLGGLDVLKRMRDDERTRRIPVVVLTTSNEQQDMLRAGDLHANSYVRKPVDFDSFVDAARQIGLYWTVVNEPFPSKAFYRDEPKK